MPQLSVNVCVDVSLFLSLCVLLCTGVGLEQGRSWRHLCITCKFVRVCWCECWGYMRGSNPLQSPLRCVCMSTCCMTIDHHCTDCVIRMMVCYSSAILFEQSLFLPLNILNLSIAFILFSCNLGFLIDGSSNKIYIYRWGGEKVSGPDSNPATLKLTWRILAQWFTKIPHTILHQHTCKYLKLISCFIFFCSIYNFHYILSFSLPWSHPPFFVPFAVFPFHRLIPPSSTLCPPPHSPLSLSLNKGVIDAGCQVSLDWRHRNSSCQSHFLHAATHTCTHTYAHTHH